MPLLIGSIPDIPVAENYMELHNVTYKCGHTKLKEIKGPECYLETNIAKFQELLCPECKDAALFEKISAYEEEKDLPKLIGESEKQINWARKVRHEKLLILDHQVDIALKHNKPEINGKENEFLGLFYQQDKAYWWIDKKDVTLNWGYKDFAKYCRTPEDFIQEWGFITVRLEDMVDTKETPVIYPDPEKKKTETICHIYSNIKEGMIYIKSDKDQTIIDVCHSIYCIKWNRELNVWNYKWEGRLYDTATFDDMIVYIAHKMLSDGVPITADREDLYDKISNGDFQRRCYHWLTTIKDDNENVMYICYKNYDINKVNTLRDRIRNVTYNGVSYGKYSYIIKARYYEKLRAWCEEYNVKISPSADKVLKEAEEHGNRRGRKKKTTE